jgi:hypothetical protein
LNVPWILLSCCLNVSWILLSCSLKAAPLAAALTGRACACVRGWSPGPSAAPAHCAPCEPTAGTGTRPPVEHTRLRYYNLLLVTFGHLWSLLVTFGHFWSLLVTLGHFWSLLVTSGHA